MDMGKHNLLNGHRGDDGAATVPPFPSLDMSRLMPLPRGPVSPLQRPDDGHPAAAEAGRMSVDGDSVIRTLTAFVVLAVAAFAAVVSYSHIFDLGVHHGQSGTAARLLPLSVDGLIAAASLVMLHAARNKLPVPLLSRLMLALGVGATVAANVAYGLPFGWLSAVVSAWPAAAFVGSVEMAIRFVSDARSVATAAAPDDGGEAGKAAPRQPVTVMDKAPVKSMDKTPAGVDKLQPGTASRRPGAGADKAALDKAAQVLRGNPGITNAAAARLAGVSAKTVQRARPLAVAPDGQDPEE